PKQSVNVVATETVSRSIHHTRGLTLGEQPVYVKSGNVGKIQQFKNCTRSRENAKKNRRDRGRDSLLAERSLPFFATSREPKS
ncbi:MAG: hypothetical protein KDD83_29810, partial [Caldilineaceae bacterium]|nr:hypothetical protein [Caldilineaceae bacterium]